MLGMVFPMKGSKPKYVVKGFTFKKECFSADGMGT